MAVTDQKKVATMIKIVAVEIARIKDAVANIETIRDKFQAANPKVAGTPLQGNVAALNSAFNDLKAESDKAIWTALINAAVSSHRGRAL